jgi:hypothetical protein
MSVSWLARRLGLDGNPLRRRTDKIAACLAALLVAVFLAGAPVVSMVAIDASGRIAGGQQARSWRQVSAVVQQAAPTPPAWELSGYSWVRARWTAPDGQARAGQVPVSTAVAAGQTVRVWVNAAGTPTGPPPNPAAVVADQAAAALVALVVLAITLLCLTCAVRWALDRHRRANWEAEWAAVGPQWTRRFQSRGE